MKTLKRFLSSIYYIKLLNFDYNRGSGVRLEILRIGWMQCNSQFEGALFGFRVWSNIICLDIAFFWFSYGLLRKTFEITYPYNNYK
jgi:hypothetical protein